MGELLPLRSIGGKRQLRACRDWSRSPREAIEFSQSIDFSQYITFKARTDQHVGFLLSCSDGDALAFKQKFPFNLASLLTYHVIPISIYLLNCIVIDNIMQYKGALNR
jgi:hypothetical protein